MKAEDVTTWKELTIGVQRLVGLLFDNHFINPGLSAMVNRLLYKHNKELTQSKHCFLTR